MNMGSFLRGLRESRGLSQRELASRLGVDPTYLCHLERGRKRFLGKKMMNKIVGHLSLTETEQQQLQDLREIAAGRLTVPVVITSEAAEILKALADASCYMTEREFGMAKLMVTLLRNAPPETQSREVKRM